MQKTHRNLTQISGPSGTATTYPKNSASEFFAISASEIAPTRARARRTCIPAAFLYKAPSFPHSREPVQPLVDGPRKGRTPVL